MPNKQATITPPTNSSPGHNQTINLITHPANNSVSAAQVVQEIKDDGGLLEAIKEFANGKDGGIEQQGSAAGRDYQNAIVLLQALRNNAVSTLRWMAYHGD